MPEALPDATREICFMPGGLLAPSQDPWALQRPTEKPLGSISHATSSDEGRICVAPPGSTCTDLWEWGKSCITEIALEENKSRNHLLGMRD